MTIRLLDGINIYYTRVTIKNEDNLYKIVFKNLQTSEEINISIADLSPSMPYFSFNIEVNDEFEEGEYIYSIYNSENKLLRTGVAVYGLKFTTITNYNESNKRIVYEG